MKTLSDIANKFAGLMELMKAWKDRAAFAKDEEKIYILDNQKVSTKIFGLDTKDSQHLYVVITSSNLQNYIAQNRDFMIVAMHCNRRTKNKALAKKLSCDVKVLSEENDTTIVELVKDPKIAFELSAVTSQENFLQKLTDLFGKERQFADAPKSTSDFSNSSFNLASSPTSASILSTTLPVEITIEALTNKLTIYQQEIEANRAIREQELIEIENLHKLLLQVVGSPQPTTSSSSTSSSALSQSLPPITQNLQHLQKANQLLEKLVADIIKERQELQTLRNHISSPNQFSLSFSTSSSTSSNLNTSTITTFFTQREKNKEKQNDNQDPKKNSNRC